MARYNEKDYTLETALRNININFLRMFQDDLLMLAKNPGRSDIVRRIHNVWNHKYNCSPSGTDIRIEWAMAIYRHGEWEKALGTVAPETDKNASSEFDPRKKYPAEFRCDNGVYVRSLSELFVADWLYANRIRFEYEREVHFPLCQKTAHCDFYLPDYKVYVEFWGMEQDEQYLEYKNWKELQYRNHGYPMISLNFQDLKMFRDVFLRKLKQVKGK